MLNNNRKVREKGEGRRRGKGKKEKGREGKGKRKGKKKKREGKGKKKEKEKGEGGRTKGDVGTCKSSSAFGRFLGSLMRQALTNSWKSLDHFLVFWRWGGSRMGICMRARIGWTSLRGGSRSANSTHVIPKDHRSTRSSYGFFPFLLLIISGAIQYGVPIKVFRRSARLAITAETPKSTTQGNKIHYKYIANPSQQSTIGEE